MAAVAVVRPLVWPAVQTAAVFQVQDYIPLVAVERGVPLRWVRRARGESEFVELLVEPVLICAPREG